jgi:hypothetical protein
MFKYFFIFLLILLLIGNPPLIAQQAADDQTTEESLEEDAISEDEDPLKEEEDGIAEDEDPLKEDDDALEAEEDPLKEEADGIAEDEDPLVEDEEPTAQESDDVQVVVEEQPGDEEEEYEIKTNIKSQYRLIGGYTEFYKGGISRENESNLEITYHFINAYQFTGRIQTSPYNFYQFRLLTYFNQKFDEENQQYTDDFSFNFREAYYKGQNGSHRYAIGAQLFKLGKVDFDSPVDVLTPKNTTALEYLDFDESKNPVVGAKYDWLGENQTVSAYFAPFKQKTPGTEYTIFETEQRELETGEQPEDRTVARPHFGVQYQYTFEIADVRIGVFRWFDQDNKITWQDPAKSVTPDEDTETDEETDEETPPAPEQETDTTSAASASQSYQEEDITINFATFEFDITLGDFVLKSDLVLFQEKNFYHFYKKTDDTTEFFTVPVKHLAFAVSIEKKFAFFFLMPSYSYRLLYDVPANTHILSYENEEAPKSEIRDLSKQQTNLIALFEFTENFNMALILSQTSPFIQKTASNIWNWTLGGGHHRFTLKILHTESEELIQTKEKIQVSKAFIEYAFQF